MTTSDRLKTPGERARRRAKPVDEGEAPAEGGPEDRPTSIEESPRISPARRPHALVAGVAFSVLAIAATFTFRRELARLVRGGGNVAARPVPPGWRELVSTEGRFAVLFPLGRAPFFRQARLEFLGESRPSYCYAQL